MKSKTISGHYGGSFSLEHNNRTFMPRNVDSSRSNNNDYCVAAGFPVPFDFPDILPLDTLWKTYYSLNSMYWAECKLNSEALWQRERELRQHLKQLHRAFRPSNNPIICLMQLLFLPISLTIEIVAAERAENEIEKVKAERLLLRLERDVHFDQSKSLRAVLREHDRKAGTALLREMDEMINYSITLSASDYQSLSPSFATLEQIYDKVFEPEFQAFQKKQRKCRRYEGTYLEQLRERQLRDSKGGKKSKTLRAPNEAIEIVFTIGDMDNTGYAFTPEDAYKSECLLRDFNQHLLTLPNVCVITTKELATPGWQPPFKHGLILLNLTAHFDEATPGVHMTAIPYSRGCTRGPSVQASLGRAMTGMGFPSTWKEVLDENGISVPKRDRNNHIIHNKDGSVRTLKEPDKQGIVDWTEEQKAWLAEEMYRRYGWSREYKGKHARGNLSTPDYQAARALERAAEAEAQLKNAVQQYSMRVYQLSQNLSKTVDNALDNHSDLDVIVNYLQTCSDHRFNELLDEALAEIRQISSKEHAKIKKELSVMIAEAQHKTVHNTSGNQVSIMKNL